jgi:hypothetical protein
MDMAYSPSIESHAQGGIALGQHFVEGDGIVPVSQPIHAALRSVVHRLALVALSEKVLKMSISNATMRHPHVVTLGQLAPI